MQTDSFLDTETPVKRNHLAFSENYVYAWNEDTGLVKMEKKFLLEGDIHGTAAIGYSQSSTIVYVWRGSEEEFALEEYVPAGKCFKIGKETGGGWI